MVEFTKRSIYRFNAKVSRADGSVKFYLVRGYKANEIFGSHKHGGFCKLHDFPAR